MDDAPMMALSLWQPWASAMAMGLKSIETRHWARTYRGQIAIHAAKRISAGEEQRAILRMFADLQSLNPAHALQHAGDFDDIWKAWPMMPRGAFVAVGDLWTIARSEDLITSGELSPLERVFGNYDPGRYGWRIKNIRPITPLPFKARQGLFPVPPDAARTILDRVKA